MSIEQKDEHCWLQQLVGRWKAEQLCTMPDGSEIATTGEMTCRTIGGIWLVAESTGQSEEGEDWTCLMTLGFDPEVGKFVGTFIASMMTHLWQYEGTLDPSGKRLELDCSGPVPGGSGHARCRDTVEIIGQDEWNLNSTVLQDDGSWSALMTSKHMRL